jgi:hypothetical protein
MIWPEEGSIDKISWVEPTSGLFLRRHPLSVRKVRGTWTDHPSMNFFRMWSGTRKAALVPARPRTRRGRLRADVTESTSGATGG